MAACNNSPVSNAQLRSVLVSVGIPSKKLKNIAQILTQSDDFIRTPSGWELTPGKYDQVAQNFSKGNDAVALDAKRSVKPVVFFGHGGSGQWRVLKDYVVDKLGCDYEEYNREPTAGYSRKERLNAMLDRAHVALLVMTAEDQMEGGSWRARENVVHEVGLFQGRLSFERAIIILESGCNEFSNIAGLDQIRYDENIMNIAHQVRDVLVREDLIQA